MGLMRIPGWLSRDCFQMPNFISSEVNGRVLRSTVAAQIDMRLQCDRANMAVRACSYIVTADVRLVFWNKI
jgi:hypothetical protein